MKILIASLSIALVCGCTSQQVTDAGNTVASAAPAVVNDALIVAQIEGYFLTIDPSSALHTAVASHDGNVKLSGRVRNATIRARFVARAKTTPYVKGVSSTIAVDVHLPNAQAQVSDFAVTVAVEGSLAAQAGVNALSIHADTHAGVVTLGGKVATPALRATMLEAAKKTTGVKSVVDRLTVGT